MHQAYLSLGTNLGKKAENLLNSISLVTENIGEVVAKSSVYKSESWGFCAPVFLNQVILVATKLPPLDLIVKIKEIENSMGRKACPTEVERRWAKDTNEYESRIIDIDIVLFDSLIVSNYKLTIPHPEMQNRLFVLQPLNEIAKNYTHPVLLKTVNQLLSDCTDGCKIEKYDK